MSKNLPPARSKAVAVSNHFCRYSLIAAGLLSALSTANLHAAQFNWIGGAAGNPTGWSAPANWQNAQVPTSLDSVQIGVAVAPSQTTLDLEGQSWSLTSANSAPASGIGASTYAISFDGIGGESEYTLQNGTLSPSGEGVTDIDSGITANFNITIGGSAHKIFALGEGATLTLGPNASQSNDGSRFVIFAYGDSGTVNIDATNYASGSGAHWLLGNGNTSTVSSNNLVSDLTVNINADQTLTASLMAGWTDAAHECQMIIRQGATFKTTGSQIIIGGRGYNSSAGAGNGRIEIGDTDGTGNLEIHAPSSSTLRLGGGITVAGNSGTGTIDVVNGNFVLTGNATTELAYGGGNSKGVINVYSGGVLETSNAFALKAVSPPNAGGAELNFHGGILRLHPDSLPAQRSNLIHADVRVNLHDGGLIWDPNGFTDAVIHADLEGTGGITYFGNTDGEIGLTLTGARNYSGPTRIASGAQFNPTGNFIGDLDIADGGQLNPGGSSTTLLSTESDLLLETNSTLAVDIDLNNESHDQIVVTGTAHYGGRLLVQVTGGDLQGGEVFQVVTAGSSTGKFDIIAGPPGPGLYWVFDPQTGQLSIPAPTVPTVVNETSALEFHVTPTGSNSNTGSRSSPFATLETARDAIRAARIAGENGLAVVWVHGGDYDYVDNTFTLNSSDINTVYRAVPGEPSPRIIGGTLLDHTWFTIVTDDSPVWSRIDSAARGKLLQIDLTAQGITDYGSLRDRGFNQSNPAGPMELFIDEESMQLARYPNNSFSHVASSISDTSFTYWANRPDRWIQAEDIWFHGFWGNEFSDGARQAASIDSLNNTITLTSPPTPYGIATGAPYFAFNLLEEIDQPGEYYINRDTGILYFWPKDSLNGRRIMVSMKPNGTLVSIIDASNITIEGFVFEGSRDRLIEIRGSSQQILIRDSLLTNGGGSGAIISTDYASDNAGKGNGFYRCEVKNFGTTGISLLGGDYAALAGMGQFVEQCHIQNFARLTFTYQPGIRIDGVGHRVRHNEIHNGPHAGIVMRCSESLIEYNEIYDVVRWAGDMGAIYGGRNWARRGNRIAYNYIHDIYSEEGVKVAGIYLDDTLSGQTVFGNILDRVQDRPTLNNGGRNNSWENNLILNSGIGHYGTCIGLIRITDDAFLNYLLEVDYQAPPWSTTYPDLAAIPNDFTLWDDNIKSPEDTVFSRNVLWNNTVDYQEVDYSAASNTFSYYAEMSDNLTGTDPLFIDEANQDFNLQPGSPVYTAIPDWIDLPFDAMGRSDLEVRQWPIPADDQPGQLTVAAYMYAPEGNTTVRFYYGPTGGGKDPSAWAYSTTPQSLTSDGFVTARIDLFREQQYIGRWMSSHTAEGTLWSELVNEINGDSSYINPIQLLNYSLNSSFNLTFDGLDTKTEYQLFRTLDLSNWLPIDGTQKKPATQTETFIDSAPPTDKAFYRLSLPLNQ